MICDNISHACYWDFTNNPVFHCEIISLVNQNQIIANKIEFNKIINGLVSWFVFHEVILVPEILPFRPHW